MFLHLVTNSSHSTARTARTPLLWVLGMVGLALVAALTACSNEDANDASNAKATSETSDFQPLPALPAGVNECSLISDEAASEILGEPVTSELGGQRSPAVGCTWSSSESGLQFFLESTVSEGLTPDLVCEFSAQAQEGFIDAELEYVADALAVWGETGGLIICLDEGSLRFEIVPTPSKSDLFESQIEQLAAAAINGLRDQANSEQTDQGSSTPVAS